MDSYIGKLTEYVNYMGQRLAAAKLSKAASAAQAGHQAPATTVAGPRPVPHGPTVSPNAPDAQQRQYAPQMAGQRSTTALSDAAQSVPPAPTTVQPPYPFGASSPHGVPIYGKPEPPPTNLKQPPAKKRKNNQAAADATTAAPPPPPGAPGGPDASATSAQQPAPQDEKPRQTAPTKPRPEPALPHRCAILECDFHVRGFGSADELARHRAEVHEVPEEHIEDPAQFALESLSAGLGLNPGGTTKVPARQLAGAAPREGDPAAPARVAPVSSRMGTTPSSSRQGDAPSTGRPPSQMSQTAARSTLAAAQSMRTPQMGSARTPTSAPSAVRATGSTDGKRDASSRRAELDMAPAGLPTPPSPWSDCSISPESLRSCFDGLDGLSDIATFNQLQILTPQDTPSSREGESGHNSDISEHDELQIKLDGSLSPAWNPFGIHGPGGDGELGLSGDDPFEMDWTPGFENDVKSGWHGTFSASGFDPDLFVMRV